MEVLLPSETPPPPGLVKDHTFYVFFFRQPLKLDSIQKLKVSKKSFSNWWSYQQENLSLLSSIDVTKFKALLLRSKKACQVRSFNKTKPHFQKVKTTSCTYQHCKHHREFSIHHSSKDMPRIWPASHRSIMAYHGNLFHHKLLCEVNLQFGN